MGQERAPRGLGRRLRTKGQGILESRDPGHGLGGGGHVSLALQIPYPGVEGVQLEEAQRRPLIVGPEQGPPLPGSESNTAFHGPSQPPRTVWGSPGPPPTLLLCLSSLACPSGQE